GWSMPDEREKFSLAEMHAAFDIERVSLGGPIFDVEKLRWLNGLWIREELSQEQLAQRLVEWAFNAERLAEVLPHLQPRIETLSDFAPQAVFLVSGSVAIEEESFASLNIPTDDLLRQLQFALWSLEALQAWDRDSVWNTLKGLADAMEMKVRDFLAPLFIAVSGSRASISVVDAMALLGPDMSRARVRHALEVLGGVSKKAAKRLEKEYRALPI
ncbi:MAG: glutamate--tRNA ligase, partial [Pseudomonadota bacterium]